MAKGNFPRCNVVTRKWEGGYSNHPSDPGGKTMNGITEEVFHAWLRDNSMALRPVRTITEAETDLIYKHNYWNPAGCERLFAGVDLAVYDASVNSGVSRGRKWLEQSVGSSDHSVTVKRVCERRSGFVHGLKTFKVFGKGWVRRIADIEVTGVQWALEAMKVGPETIQVRKEIEAEQAKKQSEGSVVASGGTASAGGGAVVTPTISPDAGWLEYALMWGLGALVLFAALWFAYRAYVHHVRSTAYQEG